MKNSITRLSPNEIKNISGGVDIEDYVMPVAVGIISATVVHFMMKLRTKQKTV